MPDALLPDDPATPEPNDWYSPEELAVFRLSSKSHWDLPIAVHGKVIHVLTSHPTPPVFDGPEDRNGRRDNERIKGIGLWFAHINGVLPAPSEYECNVYQVDTATYEWEACDDSAPTSSGQPVNVREKVSARTNCGAWNPVVECEPAKIASAVRVHVSTDDEIVGLALACDSAVFEQ